MTKKRDTTHQLAIARAQLRAITRALASISRQPISPQAAPSVGTISTVAVDGYPRFVQAWSVSRGYYGVTQALDTEGQVWERVCEVEKVIKDGKKVKVLGDSYWCRVPMTRKENGDSV